MNTTMTRTELDACLEAFIAVLTAEATAYYAAHYPRLTPPVFSVDRGGRKFLRVVRQDTAGSGRSAHCFVEVATGLIWKPDGWKKPALNFPRGHVAKMPRSGAGPLNVHGCI